MLELVAAGRAIGNEHLGQWRRLPSNVLAPRVPTLASEVTYIQGKLAYATLHLHVIATSRHKAELTDRFRIPERRRDGFSKGLIRPTRSPPIRDAEMRRSDLQLSDLAPDFKVRVGMQRQSKRGEHVRDRKSPSNNLAQLLVGTHLLLLARREVRSTEAEPHDL